MKKQLLFVFFLLSILLSCSKNNKNYQNSLADNIKTRNFKMGFSASLKQQKEKNYEYLVQNSGIYMEHINIDIPRSALINSTPLPETFVN